MEKGRRLEEAPEERARQDRLQDAVGRGRAGRRVPVAQVRQEAGQEQPKPEVYITILYLSTCILRIFYSVQLSSLWWTWTFHHPINLLGPNQELLPVLQRGVPREEAGGAGTGRRALRHHHLRRRPQPPGRRAATVAGLSPRGAAARAPRLGARQPASSGGGTAAVDLLARLELCSLNPLFRSSAFLKLTHYFLFF